MKPTVLCRDKLDAKRLQVMLQQNSILGACVGKSGNTLHASGAPPACRAVALAKAGTASSFTAASWRSPPEADHSALVGGRLGYASTGVITPPASCRETICGTGDA
ncbi:MAG: hypothetical protein GXP31_06755 [Kiritimatiellaeota bacterium]|nr:hypothetical protein [Kiritimatiellota bacterium]